MEVSLQSLGIEQSLEIELSASQQSMTNNPFQYNKHNESIFDDTRYFPSLRANETVVKFDEKNTSYINRATLRALIVQMTSPEVIDYNLICDFFLTFRTFSDSRLVMSLLLTRLIWALQYINSGSEDTETIGKLVLLRTFVVLRHWILNYFVDDFVADNQLCDMFAQTINEITANSHFVSPEKIYEAKIFTDLKVHYFTQTNEFFGSTIKLDDKQEAYAIDIPPSGEFQDKEKLQKSITQSSIHTNPSFRRLAMLSLYDLKSHHKCLMYDASTATENPQLSIQNLICQHKSSRMSLNDKLQEFNSNRVRKDRQPSKTSKRRPLSPKKNYMNIKNSSLALKKTAIVTEMNMAAKGRLDVGFSTNGNIKLPSSRISRIVPCSPVKKMEFVIKDDLGSPKKNTQGVPHSIFRTDSLVRKESFKKVMDGWKKSFYYDSKDSPFIFDSEETEAQTQQERRFSTSTESIEADNRRLDSRSDVLSARIIDELEYLIRCYVNESGGSENAMKRATVAYSRLSKNNSDFRKSSSGSVLFHPRESKSEQHLQNIIEKNHSKSFQVHDKGTAETSNCNILSRISSSEFVGDSGASESRDSSFNGRVTSIDWNAEDLKFDNSGDMTARDLTLLQPQTPDFDMPVVKNSRKSRSSNSSGYRSSDLEKLNDEINDLSIAMSPQSMKRKPMLLRVSQIVDRRYSRGYSFSSAHSYKHDSLKSYLTYDSALSVQEDGVDESPISASLKKKMGCHDLRKMLHENAEDAGITGSALAYKDRRLSHISHNSRTLSIRRSVRFSTLCGLTELPFNDFDLSMASSLRKGQLRLSDLATEPSIFSHTVSIRNSFFKEDCVSFSASSTASATVPGINNHVLKELAAIPDESFSARNPIKSALYKLEGKNGLDSKTNTSIASHDLMNNVSSNAEKPRLPSLQVVQECNTEMDHETKKIMEEIENAHTQDAIEYSSDIEEALAKAPLTPIKTQKTIMNGLISAPNINGLLLGSSAELGKSAGLPDPKFVLEGYIIHTDSLKVESVMRNGTHVPFVLSYDSRSLAEHFTMIEKDMLQEIDWKELIELGWNKDLTPVNSWLEIIANDSYYHNNKGVNLVIARFNLMVNWIISEILLTTDEKERIDVVSRFIHTAYHCLDMQNFATLMQIILALTSERLNKLRSTWNKLPPGDILTLKNLEKLTSPLKNFFNIRLCTNELIPSRGCIPFVGLYLSDLVFNAERPKFAKNISPSNTSQNDSDGTVSDVSRILTDEERMINFSRFRTSVHIVKSLSQSIEWAGQYNFDVDDELLRKCLYIKSLDEDEMKLCLDIQLEEGHLVG